MENDLVMIVSDESVRFCRRLTLLFAIASLCGAVVGCTRDLPDPGQFIQVENGGNDPQQPQEPSQPQTPSDPQQPQEPSQPQTPPEPQQPEGRVEIPDTTFRAWILWNYDSNKDGVLDKDVTI